MTSPLQQLDSSRAAQLSREEVLALLDSEPQGLTTAEAQRRVGVFGRNFVRVHGANWLRVLRNQLKNPVLVLLAITTLVSLWLGDAGNAVVIAIILLLSIGLGFINEYRADVAAEALHSRVTHKALVYRDGNASLLAMTEIVPGDIVELTLGSVVPAEMRLLRVDNLQCDESILTGESLPVEKDVDIHRGSDAIAWRSSIAFMGTIVQAGSAQGLVIATGASAEFGRIAADLGQRQPETDFQRGLRKFSMFLLWVALSLTALIFIANLLLQRPLLESLMFSLAIAVGMTPQLLPAVVSAGMSLGSKRLAAKKVLVKRLTGIEDLGDMDVLVTDKTGTLTQGRIDFVQAIALSGFSEDDVIRTGLLSSDADYTQPRDHAPGLSALDAALWTSERTRSVELSRADKLGFIAFDHARRMTTALVSEAGTLRLASKGSAEDLFRRCEFVPAQAQQLLTEQYEQGMRVVAIAQRKMASGTPLTPDQEHDLQLMGFLVFSDPPKESSAHSLRRLAHLGVKVVVCTGDNAVVAAKVCADLGLNVTGAMDGSELSSLSDVELARRIDDINVFARVDPEQKARIVRVLKTRGNAVGFLGDGVNDALGLHDADVGISVDTATDVAKDAADIVLLEKDLGVLADGVYEGRKIFSNTMKYVLMGTSGDFGNMFSAALGSVALNFLPMLPGQILLNDLLYDSSQLAIPGDNVDSEQLRKPEHWNISLIRRFMLVFGPISSLFDFATFALMLGVFHAAQPEFQAGWFVESLATETLIIFAVRTQRVPFFRSRPSGGLVLVVLAVVALGCVIPYSPVSGLMGFAPLPASFFLALVGMTLMYLVLVDAAKWWFFRTLALPPKSSVRGSRHRVNRRAASFSVRHSKKIA